MSVVNAIQVHRHGGPEVLSFERTVIGSPGPGEVRVRNRAIGLNFTDIYFRTGEYVPPRLPFIPGNEAAGEVLEVGEGVVDVALGDRVGYVVLLGAYAEESIVPARYVVRLPPSLSFETAAASMLKGLTAQYLLRRTGRVSAGQTVLVQAAAGGVGLLLTQWAKHLGATVIGTVGSPEKAELAAAHGCDHVVEYRREDVATRVRAITRGEGCHVVYDGVGRATFAGSLASLRPLGLFVGYGSASGAVDPFALKLLAARSLSATAPVLFDYLRERADVLAMSSELFDVIARGVVAVPVHGRRPLTEAAEAHRLLEARQTTGATIFVT